MERRQQDAERDIEKYGNEKEGKEKGGEGWDGESKFQKEISDKTWTVVFLFLEIVKVNDSYSIIIITGDGNEYFVALSTESLKIIINE